MIHQLENNIQYDDSLTFDEQSAGFKSLFNSVIEDYISTTINTIDYPDFNEDGSLDFKVVEQGLEFVQHRIQVHPFSTSNREVEQFILTVNVI